MYHAYADTCQIRKLLKETNCYFCKVKIVQSGEINQQSFSNPHLWTVANVAIAYNAICVYVLVEFVYQFVQVLWVYIMSLLDDNLCFRRL